MSLSPTEGTFRSLLSRLADEGFAGRRFELSLFREKLKPDSPSGERIINVYGPGGIGKTSLLAQFRHIAEESGAAYASVDMRDMAANPGLLCREAARQLGVEFEIGREDSPERDFVSRLLEIASTKPVVLAFDRFEEAGTLDEWLRVRMLPELPAKLLIVIAGRYPLGGPWLSAGWRRLTIPLPLGELEYADVRDYARRIGLGYDSERTDELWIQSAGYPLSLSLLAQLAVARQSSGVKTLKLAREREKLDALLRLWLDEAPEDDIRPLLYAASIPRSFDHELLNDISGHVWAHSLFDRLVRLSFVRRSDRSWQIHDLVRERIRGEMQERSPDLYAEYIDRAIGRLRARADASLAQGMPAAAREMSELLSLVGNPVLRAHFRRTRATDHYWETATDGTIAEAVHYVSYRLANAKPCIIACSDPESSAVFRYELTAEESVLRLRGWNVRELYAMDNRSIRLLRGPEGDVAGLAAILSIRPDTLMALTRTAASAQAISELPPDKDVIGGKYIVALDIADMERIELRSALVHLQFELAFGGALLLSAPPAPVYY
ncbi:MAG: ATP-binding protein, partial [Cohnella sp.]|nr:ATP-binding protein [Cohnella sp.]